MAGDAVDNLAAGLLEPARAAEVDRHHHAIVEALNGSVDAQGEQDALTVLEAVALTLAQLVAGLPAADRPGFVAYVATRALRHADVMFDEGVAARVLIGPDDMGQGGHA